MIRALILFLTLTLSAAGSEPFSTVGVMYVTYEGDKPGRGSCVLVSPQYVLTAYHVVEDATVSGIGLNSEFYTGIVVHTDAVHDMALVKLDRAAGDPVKLGDELPTSDELAVGYGFSGWKGYLTAQNGVFAYHATENPDQINFPKGYIPSKEGAYAFFYMECALGRSGGVVFSGGEVVGLVIKCSADMKKTLVVRPKIVKPFVEESLLKELVK